MATLNLSALKKNSSKDLLAKLSAATKTSEKGGRREDTRFWSPKIDDAGNGAAIIRLLPAKNEEDFPFVKTFRHSFQENGMWFITECATTIDQPCYCCERNRALWSTKNKKDEDIARSRGRRTRFTANVYIVKDPANPENDGKVFLWNFGQKIFEKINQAFQGDQLLGIEPMNPFGFFDGANLNLKIRTVGGFLNYDAAQFVPAKDLFDGDEDKLAALLEQCYDLSEFNAPSLYKPYEETKARFIKVTEGVDVSRSEEQFEQVKKPAAEKYVASATSEANDSSPPFDVGGSNDSDDDDDDTMAFFRKLAQ